MKTYIVTGISSGLGKAFFDILSQSVNNFVLGISNEMLDIHVAIAEKFEYIKLVVCDLSNIEELLKKLDGFDQLLNSRTKSIIFINNAAVVFPIGRIGKLNCNLISYAAHVNFVAPIVLTNFLVNFCAKHSIKLKIIHIATGAENNAIVGWPLYCATKAGCKMFFDVLRKQCYGENDIKFYSIDPGVIDTKMQEDIRASNKESFPDLDYFSKLKKDGLLSHPHDVAKKILNETCIDVWK